MESKTFIFGHQKPDTDAIVSAISLANLRKELGENAVAYRLGNINKETEFALNKFGIEIPELLEKIEKDSDVIMVDNNEFAQSVSGIENANIKMVVDHHRVSMDTKNPLYYIAEPVGCTNTIIYKLYKQNDIEITPNMAGAMLSAIVSDTLLFKSPTCTEEDKKIAQKLADLAGVDLYEYGQELLKAGTDISDLTAEQVINVDCKPFEGNGVNFKIAQVNTADLDDIFKRQEELEAAINNDIKTNNLDLYAFVATDIVNADSKVIVLGDQSKVVEKAFDVKLDNNTAFLEGVVSRKKQVLPKILDNLDGNDITNL